MSLNLEQIRQIVERVASGHGIEVVDVELRGAGKSRTLRLFIDRPGGITHADCTAMSREVGIILDVEDAVPGGSYLLEVSSPGLDRKLTRPSDYERFAGNRVRIMTIEPVEGGRRLEGRLQGLREGRVLLNMEPARSSRKGERRSDRKAGSGNTGSGDAPAGSGIEPGIEIELSNIERANLVPEF